MAEPKKIIIDTDPGIERYKLRIADFVHGADGLGNQNFPPPSSKKIEQSAADFLVEQANKFPGQVTVVALGPLTNIAMAMELDPGFSQKIVNGNVNPAAEANIYGDPDAADIVFTSGADILAVGINVTHQVFLTDTDRICSVFGSILDVYFDYHHDAYNIKGVYLHDPTCIIAAINPSLITFAEGVVRVQTTGIMRGLTLFYNKQKRFGEMTEWTDKPSVKVAVTVDAPAVVILYRAGLVTAATSLVIAASTAFLPGNFLLSTLIQQNLDLFYALGAVGLGISLFLIHIYVTEIKRTLQALWALGVLGSFAVYICLALPADQTLVQYVIDNPTTVWFVGPLFASLTGLVFKEGLLLWKAGSWATHVYYTYTSAWAPDKFDDDGVKLPWLATWMALFSVFAGESFTQPIKRLHLSNREQWITRSPATAAWSPDRPKSCRSPYTSFTRSRRGPRQALKIQKDSQGFLARKSVKQIVTIVREIEKMERWISEKEKTELIRNDAKERLRVSETDKLDRISSVDDPDSMDVENSLHTNQVDQVNCSMDQGPPSIPETVEAHENMKTEIVEEEPKTIHCMTDTLPAAEDEKDMLMEGEDEEQVEDNEKDVMMEGEDDAEQDKKRTRELLEKMAVDNEKLVGMMTELSQRNETQTRLLNALTHRVELLEKAFVAELLAKKHRKKKQCVN
ncbi:unnamed protein product [Rhodiola kirilowii]